MSRFLRLLNEKNKEKSLSDICNKFRLGHTDARVFDVTSDFFDAIPGKPFSYWVSEGVHYAFRRLPQFEGDGRTVKIGMKTGDDFRFLRLWWEVSGEYLPYAKGGAKNAFYGDIPTCVNWERNGLEVKSFVAQRMKSMFGTDSYEFWISNESFYRRQGITWSLRASNFSPRAMPKNTIFSVRGYCAFLPEGSELSSLAIMNSSTFDYIYKSALGRFGFPEFIVGVLQKLPWTIQDAEVTSRLQRLAHRAWSLKRTLDSAEESSHAFILPAGLRARLDDYEPLAAEVELVSIQIEIDAITFELYDFNEADRHAVQMGNKEASAGAGEGEDDEADVEDHDSPAAAGPAAGLISWVVGVVFGRFDWRLATGERLAPPEPSPFDPLPAKSPGMLPDGATPFHTHSGILVDDLGNPHDLSRLAEEVLARVQVDLPGDVRRWLQRDFFPLHLKQYSKSRRKAPIYWPLSTNSGGYTLWLYYPSLTSQTLYTAVNDFVEPKLEQVGRDAATLRDKGGARSRDEEKAFEALQALELELIELRDTLLHIAPTYHPNHDDGVQITAAPLWPLFRHKPWQKILRDTWAKLEKGDYDWAHLALAYWPDRVRAKCKSDKSLAIAHDLEALYIEPEPKAAKTRGRKTDASA